MIDIKEVEAIHEILIEEFGGSAGIRDLNLLESALARPFQTYDGVELYPTVLHKAASLIESLLSNHPFVDGNKRTGYVLTRLYLIKHGLEIHASEEEKYDFVISIASGKSKFEEILEWLKTHI